MTKLSQNARFVLAYTEVDEDAWPLGGAVVEPLRAALVARGWAVEETDGIDGSWTYACRRGEGGELELVILPGPPTWFVQVSPRHVPGWLGRLRGRTPSAAPAEMFQLATELHEAVVAEGAGDLRWQWDGPPDERSAREPQPAGDDGIPRATVRRR